MVKLSDELDFSLDQVKLYYATDPYLSNLPILIFHGPSTTTNSTLNSSRIQVHIFTAAGFQSFPRLTLSPNSPLYEAVNLLPRDRQGDEICRGLAFGLLKYFRELPEGVKSNLILQSASASTKSKRPSSAPTLFAEQHAADIANAMSKVENAAEVIQIIQTALQPQHISHVDIDLVLPPGSIAPLEEVEEIEEGEIFPDPVLKQYGAYAPLVKLFGEVAFLPTSKLRRAPSKANSLNRSRSFMKDQKMSLRREMGEFVDTEERYVIKMHELVNHMADDFRAKAKGRTYGSFSPSEEDLTKLFPRCLDRILAVNSAFLEAIQKVMDDSEEEAMQDLEAPAATSTGSRYGGTGRLKDPTGALAFAKVLLEWFPQFSECYQDYIRASQEFPQIISSFMKTPSSFAARVQQTGEQRLRSAVIEPVQRLPRYSLFIDNIVNYLPVLHPALSSMLKARDIITAICSLDPPTADKNQVVNRLKNIVESWPSNLHPQGRLITAIDVAEIPGGSPASSGNSRDGMLLLFGDCLVTLKKTRDCNMSARGVMAEVDKPSAVAMMASVTAAAGGTKHLYDLYFSGWHRLGDIRMTTSSDGRNIWLTSLQEMRDAGSSRDRVQPPTVRHFLLQGSYEGKAPKLSEEVAKAKIEGRFSETERETEKWSLRSIKLPAAGVDLYTAIFEEGLESLIEGRKEPAPIRIVVDKDRGTKQAPVGHYGVDIIADVTSIAGGIKYGLEVDGLFDKVYIDEVLPEHFLPTFTKRVVDLITAQHNVNNPSLTAAFISFHANILSSLHVICEGDKSKFFRPGSPVKMLSSFFGASTSEKSGSGRPKTPTTPRSGHPRTPLMGNIPSMQLPPMTRTNSEISTHSQEVLARGSLQEIRRGSVIESGGSLRIPFEEARPINPLVRLEETFTGYIAALQSRKGNVVGKVLRNRGNADELVINALYNAFIENPFENRNASEASFDVLFVAFEKFLRMAWKDQMGYVMSMRTLDSLQEKAVNLFSGDFIDYVRMVFGDMAPQNRRAFIALIKLLADLLEGCGNDGDRGALTAAFAELLVVEGEPHNYINLLDRVVEDSEKLFDGIGPGASVTIGGGSNNGSYRSRNGYSAQGSIASNASSLRRRFADTILRSNSKDERSSMWRTMSKSTRSVATGDVMGQSSLSKASALGRSLSIESTTRRPVSRERPALLEAFEERPTSSSGQANRLSTIPSSPPPEEKTLKRKLTKKRTRRSSLSDLKALMASATLGPSTTTPPSPPKSVGPPKSASPSPPRTLPLKNKLSDIQTLASPKVAVESSPRTPRTPSIHLTRIPISGGMMDRPRSMFSPNTVDQKENVMYGSTPRNAGGGLSERPNNIMFTQESITKIDIRRGHSKTVSLSSNIPALRGTTRERTVSIARPSTSAGAAGKPSQKFRLQSPIKLRERLANEAKAINEAEASLQSELSKIGEEMAKLHTGSSATHTQDISKLTTAVSALESRIPRLVQELKTNNETIKKDLDTSLQASEFKVRALDQLCKEGSAENELLYEKFNGELGKIVKALKGRGKEEKEELVGWMKEGNEEVARTKKENARLRREIVTLRTLLKAGGTE